MAHIIELAGVSGAGKSTLAKSLLQGKELAIVDVRYATYVKRFYGADKLHELFPRHHRLFFKKKSPNQLKVSEQFGPFADELLGGIGSNHQASELKKWVTLKQVSWISELIESLHTASKRDAVYLVDEGFISRIGFISGSNYSLFRYLIERVPVEFRPDNVLVCGISPAENLTRLSNRTKVAISDAAKAPDLSEVERRLTDFNKKISIVQEVYEDCRFTFVDMSNPVQENYVQVLGDLGRPKLIETMSRQQQAV